MSEPAEDSKRAISDLQTQFDRLNQTLQQWQDRQEQLKPVEQRLTELMERGTEIVDRLSATNERHGNVLGDLEARLTDWRAVEGQLREQAGSLRDICEVATNSLGGIARAEAQRSAGESHMQDRLGQLAADLQAVVTHLRGGGEPRTTSLVDGAQPWSLEGVKRLHDELREESDPGLLPAGPEPDGGLSARIESLELAYSLGKDEFVDATDRGARHRRTLYAVIAALALAIAGVGVAAVELNRRFDARFAERVAQVQREAAAATASATREIASTRQDAQQQIADAQQAARKAQTVSDLLSAPDLVRFHLTSVNQRPRSYAQLLFSRSRGMLFSGSRFPAAGAGMTAHLWLLTTGQPVSAGPIVPDEGGRVALVLASPPPPGRVVGAAVTMEPADQPAPVPGAALLSRALMATPSTSQQ